MGLRHSLIWTATAATLLLPSLANATYSPPLTQVRIDRDHVSHTPNIVYASEKKTTASTDLELTGFGVQYIGQKEFKSGFGLQLGAAVGVANVDGTVAKLAFTGLTVETQGLWAGGQLRIYQMLYKSEVDEAVKRPSAVTAFVNLRGLYYKTSGDSALSKADLEFFTIAGGVGLMAEFSLSDHISLCPYAWLTPGLNTRLDYRLGQVEYNSRFGFTLRNPLLVGLDIWVYPFPPNWNDHVALSLLASLIDTDGQDRTIAAVIGYTF